MSFKGCGISTPTKQNYQMTKKQSKYQTEALLKVQDQENFTQRSKQLNQSSIFLTSIAQKCEVFIQRLNSRVLLQQTWKNERIAKAYHIYPEFTLGEIEKMVDRDWKFMTVDEKQLLSEDQSDSAEQTQRELSRLAQEFEEIEEQK